MVTLKAIEDIKTGKIAPVFLLSGEETHLIDQAVVYFKEHILNGSEFDLHQLSASEVEVSELSSNLRTPPFLAKKRLIIISSADKQEADKLDEEAWDLVSEQADEKEGYSCLLLVAPSFDKRRKAIAKLSKMGLHIHCSRLSPQQLEDWVIKDIQRHGKRIEPKARLLLIDACENSLAKMAGELVKLSLYVGEREEIGEEDVLEVVEASHLALLVFDLNKYINLRKISMAMKLIRALFFLKAQYFRGDPAPPIISIMGQHIKKLLLAKELGRTTAKGILASKLAVPPYYVNDYVSGAENYTLAELKRALSSLVRLDYLFKIGRVEAEYGLMLWITELFPTDTRLKVCPL